MCMFLQVKMFFINGWRTFRLSSKGEYDYESEAVKDIRHEMFSPSSGSIGDAYNMHRDLMMVGRDMRAGLNKIALTNGNEK